MPYVAKTEAEKKALAADREKVAEANKQAWLAQANYDMAEDDALAEALADANDEIDSEKVDSKTAAEKRLKAHNTIKARFAADRAAGVWPLTKAEREAKAANDAKLLKEQQDKVAAEAKAAAEAKPKTPVPPVVPATKLQVGPGTAPPAPQVGPHA